MAVQNIVQWVAAAAVAVLIMSEALRALPNPSLTQKAVALVLFAVVVNVARWLIGFYGYRGEPPD
jgi:hypothetical protein